MLNKNQVLEMVKNTNVYATSETGSEAEKNAFNDLNSISNLTNPVLKFVDVYDDETFELEDGTQICDGDSIYILEEK